MQRLIWAGLLVTALSAMGTPADALNNRIEAIGEEAIGTLSRGLETIRKQAMQPFKLVNNSNLKTENPGKAEFVSSREN